LRLLESKYLSEIVMRETKAFEESANPSLRDRAELEAFVNGALGGLGERECAIDDEAHDRMTVLVRRAAEQLGEQDEGELTVRAVRTLGEFAGELVREAVDTGAALEPRAEDRPVPVVTLELFESVETAFRTEGRFPCAEVEVSMPDASERHEPPRGPLGG